MARRLVHIDCGVLTVLLVTLAASVLLFGRANILADLPAPALESG